MVKGSEYNGLLHVGQRVYSGLYGGRHGLIFHIQGPQDPDGIRRLGKGAVVMGGRAMCDVVFDDGTISHGIPECIIRGVQWDISNEVADADEIDKALFFAEAEEVKRQDAAEKKRLYQEKVLADLPGQYPYLKPMSKGDSGHSTGSRNLKKELARAFKGVKFSVKSKSYTGGDSIDVSWTGGPSRKDVEAIANKYQEGTFDGMTDSYNYDRDNMFYKVFGGAKYVFCSRTTTDEEVSGAIATVWADYGFPGPKPSVEDYRTGNLWHVNHGNTNAMDAIHRELEGIR